MEQRPIGSTGVSVSTLGFGCGAFAGLLVRGDRKQQVRTVQRAVEGGVNYFDTAAQYGDGQSEANLGAALAEIGATDDVVIGTKVRFEASELEDPEPVMRRSLQESLKRLRRDVVDVYVLHNFPRPSTDRNGVLTGQLARIASAMQGLRDDGLVRSIGLTGVGDTTSILAAVDTALFDFVQCYYNVLNPSAVHAGACGDGQDFKGAAARTTALGQTSMGVRTMAGGALVASEYRSPLAGPVGSEGGLGGSTYDCDLERARRLIPLAERWGCRDVIEFGLRFAISDPRVATALVGISDLDQVETALQAVGRGALPQAALDEAVALARNGLASK